jgi:hypothetical protein
MPFINNTNDVTNNDNTNNDDSNDDVTNDVTNDSTDYSSDSNNDYNDSNDDYNDSNNDSNYDNTLEPLKRYIIFTEIYNSRIHGYTRCDGQFLVNTLLKNTNYFKKQHIVNDLNQRNREIVNILNFPNPNGRRSRYMHPFIRNYTNILESNRFNQVQIAQCILLDSGEYIAIIKTFYIRIIQRAWKKAFAKRIEIQNRKRIPANILHRVRHGTWPLECLYMPTIRGLLVR